MAFAVDALTVNYYFMKRILFLALVSLSLLGKNYRPECIRPQRPYSALQLERSLRFSSTARYQQSWASKMGFSKHEWR